MYIVLTAFSVTFLFWLNYHMGKGIFWAGLCVKKVFKCRRSGIENNKDDKKRLF
jgi:hypothetical protein